MVVASVPESDYNELTRLNGDMKKKKTQKCPVDNRMKFRQIFNRFPFIIDKRVSVSWRNYPQTFSHQIISTMKASRLTDKPTPKRVKACETWS